MPVSLFPNRIEIVENPIMAILPVIGSIRSWIQNSLVLLVPSFCYDLKSRNDLK